MEYLEDLGPVPKGGWKINQKKKSAFVKTFYCSLFGQTFYMKID